MSGHSKWSTIKRKKEATDQARGKLFSKLSRAIAIAVKTGGGANPETNLKLKSAIDIARSYNLPKNNIDRVLSKASEEGDLFEVTYEGYGPDGISVIVESATDNRNRTGQEIKGIFERVGGNLAGPGAVSFNFDSKGFIVVEKQKDVEGQILSLIDLGAEDVEETSDAIEVFTNPQNLSTVRRAIESAGHKVISFEKYLKPKMVHNITDVHKAKSAIEFLEKLEDHDDVQKVFTNLNIPESVLGRVD